VSTILDALKRLEDENSDNAAKHLYLTSQQRAVYQSNSRRRLIALACLTILVGGGTVAFWAFNAWKGNAPAHHQTPPENQTIAAVSEKPLRARPVNENHGGRTAAGNQGAGDGADRRPPQSKAPAALNARTGLTSPNYLPPNPEGARYQTPDARTKPQSQTVAAPDLGFRETIVPSGLNSSAGSPATRSDTPPPDREDPHARVEVLPKDALQLQAISWSDIPSARLTIIAGSILREGQTVDGYTVVEIRPNDVITEKAGKRWKLVYGGQ
jgi:hypothetical protein